MAETQDGPKKEYLWRLDARRAVVRELEERHIRLGNLRLAVAVCGALMAWLSFSRHMVHWQWLGAPAAIFIVLVIVHSRVLRARKMAERSVAFYERGLARLEDRWAGQGETGESFHDPAHPYEEDLDIFGNGSLYQLLCTTRLRSGETTLASWLLEPAAPEDIAPRQEAVRELTPQLDLREELALLGEDLRSGIHPVGLARWAEQPLVFDSLALRIIAPILACLSVAGAVLWVVKDSAELFLVALILVNIFLFRYRKDVKKVVDIVGEHAYGLALMSEVLERFERATFHSPRLVALRKELDSHGAPPSKRISQLNFLMQLLDSADHALVRAFGPLVLYVPQIAFAVEAWRKRSGPKVRTWLKAIGEIEALCALANYAYEHPGDVFPEFVEGEPLYEGEGLSHPLLPEARAIRNDVRLGGELRAMVVSGSNMSGKSTLLRTVGVNAVMAMAGAPVRARKLRLTRVSLGASIRTMDSLQGGTSRFYAEIKRLSKLVDLTKGPLPLLFLLDELLQGTNSHDRKIGAEAVVRGMIERGSIGLLTTHDLALTDIAEALAPRTVNVHFEDHLANGKISFDYTLRPGVVEKSNALELMRSVGLDV